VLDKDGVITKTNDAGSVRPTSRGWIFNIGEVDTIILTCAAEPPPGARRQSAILKGRPAVLEARSIFTAEYEVPLSEEERWFLMRVMLAERAKGVVISHADVSRRVGSLGVKQRYPHARRKREELES
jgi:hypothetical protein